MAALNGHVECLEKLLTCSADPNKATTDIGCTPVYSAAQHGHVDIVTVLLAHNADPNQARTDNGKTALHAAALQGGLSAAHLLVVHGANTAAVDFSGNVPSFYAAQNGHQCVAEWLNAVATWSWLRVAAALRMHPRITLLLQEGRLDPDDRVMFPAAEIIATIAASAASPAELPWEDAFPTCQTTIARVRDASFGWKCSTQWLYHANVRDVVFAVLVVADRLEKCRANINAADAADAAMCDCEEFPAKVHCGKCDLLFCNECDAGAHARGTRKAHVRVPIKEHMHGEGEGEGGGADPAAPVHAPLLPPELWLFIMHFFQRSWWRAVDA